MSLDFDNIYGELYDGIAKPTKPVKVETTVSSDEFNSIKEQLSFLKNEINGIKDTVNFIKNVLVDNKTSYENIMGVEFVSGFPVVEDTKEEISSAKSFVTKFMRLVSLSLKEAERLMLLNDKSSALEELYKAIDYDKKLQPVMRKLIEMGHLPKREDNKLPNIIDDVIANRFPSLIDTIRRDLR